MQRNWVGRSEGARVRFALEAVRESSSAAPRPSLLPPRSSEIEVFTTRIDTIYGANFIVLAPEHPLVQQFAETSSDPQTFRAKVAKFTSQDRSARMTGEVEKEGFDTGRRAINPFTGRPVPIWVANFVLIEYGTGAVMGVPGHDQRDFDFARKYKLPITVVVQKPEQPLDPDAMIEAHAGEGVLVNSGEYNGMPWEDANVRMTADAEKRGIGEATVQYRLKDWGISRQRYWGTPIPVVYCDTCGMVPVPSDQLPVLQHVLMRMWQHASLKVAQLYVKKQAYLLREATALIILNLYSGSLAGLAAIDTASPIKPSLRNRIIAVLVIAILGTAGSLLLPADFLTTYNYFLTLLIYFLTPWTAVNLVDFYLVRKGDYAIQEIFKPRGVYGGFNWRGLVAYFAGFAVMIPFFSIGTFFTGPVASAAGGADFSIFVGLPFTALLYYLLTRTQSFSEERRLADVSEAELEGMAAPAATPAA